MQEKVTFRKMNGKVWILFDAIYLLKKSLIFLYLDGF